MERDNAKTRFMFMHYGNAFNVKAFQEQLGIVFCEGSVDSHSRNYTFIRTSIRLRASQVEDAIVEYNSDVSGSAVIHLTTDIGQPVILTAARGALKQAAIYKRINEDKESKQKNEPSNYWSWLPDDEVDGASGAAIGQSAKKSAKAVTRQREESVGQNDEMDYEIGRLKDELILAENLLEAKDGEIRELKSRLESEAKAVEVLQTENDDLKRKSEEMDPSLALSVAKDKQVKKLNRELLEAKQTSSDWESKFNSVFGVVKEKDNTIINLRRLLDATGVLAGQTQRDREYETRIAALEETVETGENVARDLRRRILELQNRLVNQETAWKQEKDSITSDAILSQQRRDARIAALEGQCFQLGERNKELGNGALASVEQALKLAENSNRTLARQVSELTAGRANERPSLYDLLYSMAACMNQMGKDAEEIPAPHPTFQAHVKALVAKCLEGLGLDARDVASRQHEIFSLLNAVYAAAMMRGEDVGIAERSARIGSGMAKVSRAKRQRM